MTKVQRWEVPNDGKDHTFTFKGDLGDIGYVDKLLKIDGIEFWTFEYVTSFDPAVARTRTFQVFSTGVEIPPGYTYVGTTARILSLKSDVLHLFEKKV